MSVNANTLPNRASRFPAAGDSGWSLPAARRLGGPLEPFKRLAGSGRRRSEQDLLRQIRRLHSDLGLDGCSDTELREYLAQIRHDIKGQPSDADPDGRLVWVFAIADESIRRRLGVWRIFDPAFDRQGLEIYFQIARSGSGISDLDPDERIIVDTLRRIQNIGRGRYGWDVMLPAEFYRAVACKDTGNLLPFQATDEQILAGLHLLRGRIVEMNAGEGKTVAAAFPIIMHAVLGRSVHVVTANDYLADRDCDLLAPVYRSLGLSVDAVLGYMVEAERRDAYRKRIVYGTMREFGFDFLRDNIAASTKEQVQTPLQVAIIDEADQALIDEARTPMIIAGSPLLTPQAINRATGAVDRLISLQHGLFGEFRSKLDKEPPDSEAYATLLGRALLAQPDNDDLRQMAAANPRAYRRAQAAIYPDGSDYPDESLTSDLFYVIDTEERFVTLTAKGIDVLEKRLGAFYSDGQPVDSGEPAARLDGAYQSLSRNRLFRVNLANLVYQLLRANLLLKKDVDYLVTEDTVVLIDRYSGRLRPDTRYQHGLHPALEAKESVTVNPDCESLAEISVQGFANRYQWLSGITGTAVAAAEEFRRKYSLNVVAIPTARPLLRQDLPGRIYVSGEDKLAGVADEVKFWQQVGRPVLVGVQTVDQSARVSEHLSELSISHQLLNAVTGHDEAEIVRQAGAFGAVTVATNMAGRGTDIILEADLDRRILDNYAALLLQRLAQESAPVAVRCYTGEEADLLVKALTDIDGLAVTRRSFRKWEEVTIAGSAPPKSVHSQAAPAGSIEFGLGLYVINAEFNESLRVTLQLKGRSGRQGRFGSTRFFLSWDDRKLAYQGNRMAGLAACRKTDAAGRVCFEGRGVEQYLRRRQEEAEKEEAVQRSVTQDYAAVSDARTEAYYRARQGVMFADDLLKPVNALVQNTASLLVDRHFPGLDCADYDRQLVEIVSDLERWYGVEDPGLRGLGLDRLAGALEELLAARLESLKSQFSDGKFKELARLLMLQCGDEVWKDYRDGLRSLTITSRLGNYGHKSAVADYIIHAADGWERFRDEAADLFLSRLLTFPLARLTEEPARPEGMVELGRDIAMLVR